MCEYMGQRKPMDVYLDDMRPAPEGFKLVTSYEECIRTLSCCVVGVLSLDHDLGEGKTGYDVLCWLEEQTHKYPGFRIPQIRIHSMNPVGRARMLQVLKRLGQ